MAPSTAKRLGWFAANNARSGRLNKGFAVDLSIFNKSLQAPVFDHMAAAADAENVSRLVVSSVTVPMMSLHGGLVASLASSQRISHLRPLPLRLSSGSIPFPAWMIFAHRRAAERRTRA
jgi:hypothetical protein